MADALDAALARIAQARAGGFGLFVARRSEAGEGWHAAGELARDDGPLDALVDGMARSAGTDLRNVGGEWLLELLAWHGAALTAAAMMSGRWVPDLRPPNVLVGVENGALLGLALRGGGVRERAGERALARAAHEVLVAHLEPLIDALVARRLRPRRALWRAEGDRVGQAFPWCAEAYHAPAREAAGRAGAGGLADARAAAERRRRGRRSVPLARELLPEPLRRRRGAVPRLSAAAPTVVGRGSRRASTGALRGGTDRRSTLHGLRHRRAMQR